MASPLIQDTPKRQTSLYLVNTALFVSALGSAVTGLLLWLFIGRGPAANKYLWGWHRHDWGDLHLCFSLAFIVLAVWHFVQHWRWVRTVTPRQARAGGAWRGAGRIVASVLITLALVAAAFGLIRGDWGAEKTGEGHGRGAGRGQYETAGGAAPVSGETTTGSQEQRGPRRRRGGAD